MSLKSEDSKKKQPSLCFKRSSIDFFSNRFQTHEVEELEPPLFWIDLQKFFKWEVLFLRYL